MLIYNSHFSIKETDPCPANELQVKGSEEETLCLQARLSTWLERRQPLFLCLSLLPLPAGRGDVMTVMEEPSFERVI